ASRGTLGDATRALGLADALLPATGDATLGIVLAAAGYPGSVRTGDPIDGLETVGDEALVFHAGTARDGDGRFRTKGGRILTVVARGSDLAAARAAAERAAERITWPGLQRRHDIGSTAVPAGAAR
ncbi:MAG TPA: phosphoribosylglycinamide synthetase C domain-containing protein, partial [Candidatus Limnocylindrales bacterium]